MRKTLKGVWRKQFRIWIGELAKRLRRHRTIGLLSIRPASSQQDRNAVKESFKTRRPQITTHIGRGELREALTLESEQLQALCAMYGDKDSRTKLGEASKAGG